MKRLIMPLLLTPALLAACGDDINATLPGEGGGGAGGGGDAVCPAVGNLQPTPLGDMGCEITGELVENGTLSAAYTWYLEGGLHVGSESAQATLTIEAGTQIRGDNVGESDYLLVLPGSALIADGTAGSPIHFLSDDEDVDGSAEWGGLFLRGYEGLETLAGTQGANVLDYVVVAEAGADVDVTIDGTTVSYQDNIVLNGVDNTTTLRFVQSHNSGRDGIHILNGDPRLSWILVTGAQRDGIWYRDFGGLIKDLMVIHHRDTDSTSGRAGIYASETEAGDSNPRIVNATLVGRDSTSEQAGPDSNEFGILFADNTDMIRLANVLIANFRHGCFEADSGADLTALVVAESGPNYVDGVHCANEAGPNPSFGVVREGSVGFPDGTVNGPDNNGLVYYNGATNPIVFTGEITERADNFTASWYLNNIGGRTNGLVADENALNAFLDGDTNNNGIVDGDDVGAEFIINDANPFNLDVAPNTRGYDLTHIGSVRGGAVTNTQFDFWTVSTNADEGFVVRQPQN